MKSMKTLTAAGAMVLFSTVAMAQSGLPASQTANGVEYVSGGFGEDGAQAFKQAEASWPLSLVFAEDAGGGSRPYVAEVRVVIKDASGNVRMEVPSAGPYFLARLEPGAYTVEATYLGKTQTQKVTVGQGETRRHTFAWKTGEVAR